jgi:four helix bundle protein
MDIHSHEDLMVWQKAMDLVIEIYQISRPFPKEEMYGLTSQIRRAAVSIPANIAEGHARTGRRDFAHFLSIARGSLSETQTLLALALRLKYIDATTVSKAQGMMDEIGRMLNKLYNSLLPPSQN